MRCGNMELATELYAYSFEQGRLKENAPDGILHILAYMGYPLPSEYIVDCVLSNDQDACLALLHMPYDHHYVTPHRESMIDLYQQLFAWSTPHVDDSILGAIGNTLGIDHRLMERFYHLRSTMELAVRYEIERMI